MPWPNRIAPAAARTRATNNRLISASGEGKARGLGGKPRATGKASGDGGYGLASTRSAENPSAAMREEDQGECHQHGAHGHLPLRIRGGRRQHDALCRLIAG